MSNEYDAMVGEQMKRHVADIESQLAQREHDCQDMETKLHNECQAHERTRKQLEEAKKQKQYANGKLSEALVKLNELRALLKGGGE